MTGRSEPWTEWRELAACQGLDSSLFFAERGDHATVMAAKRVCAGCVVRAECLAYALATNQRFGIWGGLSERQRRRLRGERPANHQGEVA